MLKAVIFDLDATLLDINLSAFVAVLARDESSLIAQVGRKRHLTAFAAFTRAMWVLNMGGRTDARTNREVFDGIIEQRCGVVLSDPVVADMMEFYEREVLPLRNGRFIGARPMPGAREAVEAVLDRGLRTALFTNPCSSLACAETRLAWGGLSDLPFELITTLENSRRCKPDTLYYLDGLEAMGLAPEEVLMVGNDARRDFPEPDCGLQTAYVGGGKHERAVWCGSMADFAASLDEIAERFRHD